MSAQIVSRQSTLEFDGTYENGVHKCAQAIAQLRDVKDLANRATPGIAGELRSIANYLAEDTVRKLCDDRGTAEDILRAAGFSPGDFAELAFPK